MEPITQKLSTNAAFLMGIFILTVFFVMFTFPIADGDCFWHLATGKWIFDHHTLPASDPLSFTITDHNPWRPDSNRIPFLLKQYWLGQLALYGTWKLAGTAGIVLLRAVTYTALMSFLLAWMRRINNGIFPFVLIILTGFILREIPNERPQLFSFLLMPAVLYLLEYICGKTEKRHYTKALIVLPITMLVWANTHGAYLLGVILIACYLAVHIFSSLRLRQKPDYHIVISLLAGITVTCFNPSGLTIWKEFVSTSTAYSSTIYENLPPLYAAIKLHDWYPAYWAGLLLAVAGFIRCRAHISPAHLLAMSALTVLSLTGLRYIIFPLMAAPLFVGYLPELPVRKRSAGLLLAVLALWLGFTWNSSILTIKEQWKFPAGAASFMKQNTLTPNSFSYYDWGGYLALSVPGFKTFVDGRGLAEELSQLYDQVLAGESWMTTFDHYGINSVVMPGISEFTGSVFPLIEALSNASNWHLVFADSSTLVFIRDIPENKSLITRSSINKLAVQQHLIQLSGNLIKENPDNEILWQTRANALQLLGDRDAALKAYKQVLHLNPNNTWARRMLLIN